MLCTYLPVIHIHLLLEAHVEGGVRAGGHRQLLVHLKGKLDSSFILDQIDPRA